ncbi:periplasmic heavy metal sensor [Hirschia maritima]|uniref:periplasmic heavy metal sensor n=1 Tax=Hirschia maritima TaxID=1121961 RepID=UPI000367FD20|nr:periplasmic heavy metal sensor [Hirschia maritima]
MIDTNDKSHKSSQISLVLAASLAVNACLVGIVGGKLIFGQKSNEILPKEEPRSHIQSAFKMLEADDQRVLRRTMMEHWKNTHKERRERRVNFEKVVENIRAEPFDRELVEAEIREFMRIDAELKVQAVIGLLDVMETLSPDARIALADSILLRKPKMKLEKGKGKFGPRHKMHKGEHTPPRRPPPHLRDFEDDEETGESEN